MHKLTKIHPHLEISILEKISADRPAKFRRRQVTVSAESVTIGTADNCDIQLRQFLDSFLFEIKYSEDSWWIVNPLRTPHLLINGNAIELEAKLHAEDEIQIEGHKLKTAIKKSHLVEVPKFIAQPESDEALWRFLIEDADFDEIMINGNESIYIDFRGSLFRSPWSFREKDFINRKIFEETQKTSGWVSWRKNRLLRIHAAMPPIVEETHLTIRKARQNAFSLTELQQHGFGTAEQFEFLRDAIREKKNIVIAGGTSTGKTSLLRTLVRDISIDDRILIAEEETEVDWPHPHAISLESGRGNLRQTVIECLRMRPTRLIIAEIRGPEAFEMLQAMNTGHAGSMTTVHANSPREALHRIEGLAICSDLPLSITAIRRQISQAIHIIVQLKRDHLGRRMIDQIVQITGMEKDIILLSDPVGVENIGLKQKSE